MDHLALRRNARRPYGNCPSSTACRHGLIVAPSHSRPRSSSLATYGLFRYVRAQKRKPVTQITPWLSCTPVITAQGCAGMEVIMMATHGEKTKTQSRFTRWCAGGFVAKNKPPHRWYFRT